MEADESYCLCVQKLPGYVQRVVTSCTFAVTVLLKCTVCVGVRRDPTYSLYDLHLKYSTIKNLRFNDYNVNFRFALFNLLFSSMFRANTPFKKYF